MTELIIILRIVAISGCLIGIINLIITQIEENKNFPRTKKRGENIEEKELEISIEKIEKKTIRIMQATIFFIIIWIIIIEMSL